MNMWPIWSLKCLTLIIIIPPWHQDILVTSDCRIKTFSKENVSKIIESSIWLFSGPRPLWHKKHPVCINKEFSKLLICSWFLWSQTNMTALSMPNYNINKFLGGLSPFLLSTWQEQKHLREKIEFEIWRWFEIRRWLGE